MKFCFKFLIWQAVMLIFRFSTQHCPFKIVKAIEGQAKETNGYASASNTASVDLRHGFP